MPPMMMMVSPMQSRSTSHGSMMHPGGPVPMVMPGQAMMGMNTPQQQHQHLYMSSPHYNANYDEHRHHLQSGSPSTFASPSMTPRNMYAMPMGTPGPTTAAGVAGYGPGNYYGNMAGHHMRPHHGGGGGPMAGAPVMTSQHSSGPYMNVQSPYGYGSPANNAAYPHNNGYPSPGRMAPMMAHQMSQQGSYGPQYGQGPAGRGYGHYGTSPHHMNQRAMSSGYGKGPGPAPQPTGTSGCGMVNNPSSTGGYNQIPEEAK